MQGRRVEPSHLGYKLLKKKADALTMRYRSILKKIVEAKTKMGSTMKQSAFALTEAKYVAGEGIVHTVMDSVDTANVKVGTNWVEWHHTGVTVGRMASY